MPNNKIKSMPRKKGAEVCVNRTDYTMPITVYGHIANGILQYCTLTITKLTHYRSEFRNLRKFRKNFGQLDLSCFNLDPGRVILKSQSNLKE